MGDVYVRKAIGLTIFVFALLFTACGSEGNQRPRLQQETFTVAYEKDSMILLCEVPEEKLQLYGLGEFDQVGMVLYQNDTATYFPWKNRTPYQRARMAYADYNGDEKNEIAIIIGAGEGTGLFLEDLHVFTNSEVRIEKRVDGNNYVDHALRGKSVESWISEVPQLISPIRAEINTIQLAGKSYQIRFPIAEGFIVTKVVLGDIVTFSFEKDDGIYVEVGVYVECARDQQLMHEYCGTIRASVVFDGSTFSFDSFSFEAYPQYSVG